MAAGSMPGTGTKDSKRNRISAPIVNHSLFLSSVAFWKLANEMLEARCSAADAMLLEIPLGSAGHIGCHAVIASVAKQSRATSGCRGASRRRNDDQAFDLAALSAIRASRALPFFAAANSAGI